MDHPKRIGVYTILGVLGEGGFGVVFRAEHQNEDIASGQGQVVIKTLHPHIAVLPEFRDRFQREADLLAAVDHPGVVPLLDLIAENETLALVLELVPGEELAEKLDDFKDVDRLVGLVEGLAATLDHLHALTPEPVIHRDLKPSNVLVTPEGKPVLIDFGIARAGASRHTLTGTGMGTVHYMAPEQYIDAKRVDARADIYALGLIAFQLLTDGLPWEAELSDYQILRKKHDGELELSATGNAREVFEQVLAPRREDRFQGAGAFAAALRQALTSPQVGSAAEGSLDVETPVAAGPSTSKAAGLTLAGCGMVSALGLGGLCACGLLSLVLGPSEESNAPAWVQAPEDSVLSILSQSGSECVWSYIDPLRDLEAEVLRFSGDCPTWFRVSPSGKRAVLQQGSTLLLVDLAKAFGGEDGLLLDTPPQGCQPSFDRTTEELVCLQAFKTEPSSWKRQATRERGQGDELVSWSTNFEGQTYTTPPVVSSPWVDELRPGLIRVLGYGQPERRGREQDAVTVFERPTEEGWRVLEATRAISYEYAWETGLGALESSAQFELRFHPQLDFAEGGLVLHDEICSSETLDQGTMDRLPLALDLWGEQPLNVVQTDHGRIAAMFLPSDICIMAAPVLLETPDGRWIELMPNGHSIAHQNTPYGLIHGPYLLFWEDYPKVGPYLYDQRTGELIWTAE